MNFVKVCGITTTDDALVAARVGADAVGMILAPSQRRISPERAKEIADSLSSEDIRLVGVFVNESPDEVERIAREVGLDIVQLHGDEPPEEVADLRGRGLKVMKAFRVKDADSISEMDDFDADLYLLDAFSERARGGTGETFDWDVAKALRGRANIVVSGGLKPENVAEALEFFVPFGVDASSSLEQSPGVKDAEMVRRFVRAAKSR